MRTLPDVGATAPYRPFQYAAGGGGITSSDTLSYSTLDIDGDRSLDLVVTSQTSLITAGTKTSMANHTTVNQS